ncbi:cell surface glycoprotein CD200 receptor 1-like [Fundulus diaphanus]
MVSRFSRSGLLTCSLHLLLTDVNREAAFNLGTNVHLTCTNKTWADILFIIWDVNLTNKNCRLSVINDGKGIDSCNDGKSIQQTSTGHLYLHIPNLSADHVGVYRCESVYSGGNENYNIQVDVTAPPGLSAWLERRHNKMVAVCRAERGTPAANLSWSYRGSSEPAVKTQLDTEGFITVESHLELLEDFDPEDLTCTVQHLSWDQEKILVPKPREENYSFLLWIRAALVIILIFSGCFLLALKKCHRPL